MSKISSFAAYSLLRALSFGGFLDMVGDAEGKSRTQAGVYISHLALGNLRIWWTWGEGCLDCPA